MKIDLKTSLGRLKLNYPVLVASGTFGYGDEYKDVININRLGGIITKTITLTPREGNAPPRLVETPAGLLNSIGLQNVGIEKFLKEKLPRLSFIKIPVIVSIAGETIDEFRDIARMVSQVNRITGIELNLSCPNIKKSGRVFAEDEVMVAKTVLMVKRVYNRPMLVKLSPFVYDIVQCARAAHSAGADGVTVANTFPGMAVDVQKHFSRLGSMTGGLSGPAIRPLALRLVWLVASQTRVPVLGSGGISSVDDALEFFIAGAKAVSVGTALYTDPETPEKIIAGLTEYLAKKKISTLSSIMGSITCRV